MHAHPLQTDPTNREMEKVLFRVGEKEEGPVPNLIAGNGGRVGKYMCISSLNVTRQKAGQVT